MSTNHTLASSKMRRMWGTKVYLEPNEEVTNEEDAEIVRLTAKQFGANSIDRKSFMHFSNHKPSHLLFSLCSVLASLGICYKIAEDKMKVTFETEKTT